ncbi:LysR family transcriptional regulator [Sutterella sp.]|uniref:LysR family transcriptional regulator n=1 Tax=Sutterella sp. TaxID=1981025 RepID=UPI0026E01772|nr:LysR family transcriptional regulator [Sutterella sp.]MDO5532726.1 LysR family transcriptional regulator [Sutterella sp.]
MKIRQIRAFLAVARTGGVRRAAAALCLTQSTVAKAVSQLEAELGSPLFERNAMGLRLNDAGRSMLPYAETIVANADRAAAAVAEAASGRVAELRISVTPTLPPDVLSAALARFRGRFPAVKLRFTSGFFSDCMPRLLTDKLDLSLVMSAEHQHEALNSLVEEPLCEIDQGVVAGIGHPILEEGADVRRHLTESEWLTTVQDEKFLMERFASMGIPMPRSLTLCDFYTVDALNGMNGALSLSPLSVTEDPRYTGKLEALPPEKFPLPPLTISFFRRRAVELSPAGDFMRLSIREAFDAWIRQKPRRFIRPL